MENWKSRLVQTWQEWKPELKKFSIAFLILWACLYKEQYLLAVLVAIGTLVWFAAVKWGGKYQQIGAYMMSEQYKIDKAAGILEEEEAEREFIQNTDESDSEPK